MGELTLATLNLLNHRHGRWDERAPLVVRDVLEIRPDVFAVQEVDASTDRAAALAGIVNRRLNHGEYEAHSFFNPNRKSIKSLAILSRLPVVEHEGLDYLVRNDIAQRVRVRLPDGARLDVYNTHLLYAPSREGASVRREQVQRLLAWIERHERDVPVAVLGDFNALPGGGTIALMRGRFRSALDAVHGREPDRTWWAPLEHPRPELPPGFRSELEPGTVDYIFLGPGVEVLDARVAFDRPDPHDRTLYPSDHFGLVARVRVG